MKSEKQLYQWDVNQFLTELQPTAQFVDYPMGNEVIRIETDGKRCRIPDEFLQTAGFKRRKSMDHQNRLDGTRCTDFRNCQVLRRDGKKDYEWRTSTASATPLINSAGEDGTGKNMPPYLSVNVWKRLE